MTEHIEILSFNVPEINRALEAAYPQRWRALDIPNGATVTYTATAYPTGRLDLKLEWEA